MKIVTVQFDYAQSQTYNLLSRVFEASCKAKAPKIKFEIIRIPTPSLNVNRTPSVHGQRSDTSNTVKLELWLDCMENSNEDIIFADCDMLMLNDPSTAFDDDFDIGICKCSNISPPYNGGIVFAKNTQRAKNFIKLWDKVNKELYNDPKRHKHWAAEKKYAGMNQAAFGCIWEEHLKMQTHNKVATIKFFPCLLWNATRPDWHKVNIKKTYFVHIKSELRPRCVNQNMSIASVGAQYRELVNIWRSYANSLKLSLPKMIIKKKGTHVASLKLPIYTYKDYSDYVNMQKETTEKKLETKVIPWVKKENIKFLANYLKSTRKHLTSGICHGTRTGEEQKYFKVFLNIPVIGTEICDKAAEIPNTVIWDFNKENPEWFDKFDFIYTNSFDHCYSPGETFIIWTKQIRQNGVIIIEYTSKHSKPNPTKSDPVCFSAAEMIGAVNSWTNGKWKVTGNYTGPTTKSINGLNEIVKFLIIERTVDYDRQAKKMERSI